MPVFLNNFYLGNESTQKISKNVTSYSLDIPEKVPSKLHLQNNNFVQIVDENGNEFFSYNINPNLENIQDISKKLSNNEYQFNCDMYEELIPFKYSIIKRDNDVHLKNIICTLRRTALDN